LGPTLDPSAPLDPMPDLGLDWPDMEQKGDDLIPDAPTAAVADATTERSYTVSLTGLDAAETGDLKTQFQTLSTLEQKKGDPANASAAPAGGAGLRADRGPRGYAFADVGTLEAAADHETRPASLPPPVPPNGARRFGRIVVVGKPLFGARHIQQIARFEPGES